MAARGNVAAVMPEKQARIVIQTREIPTPGADELLVRNYAVAANPADWKIQDYALFIQSYPTVLGSDVCGEVLSVGNEVTKFKKGNRVCGFAAVIYNSNPDAGAWQTYTILRELSTAKIPDSMSYVDGSVFPMAFATALIGLFAVLGVDQTPGAGAAKDSILLVWGAASSVGSAAIQIARLQGYTVYGVASKSNHAWIARLGAGRLFDYHDADVIDQIVAAAKADGRRVKLAFDAVSENATFDQVPAVVKQSAGAGKVCGVLGFPEDKKAPEGVEIGLAVAYQHAVDNASLGAWMFNEWLPKKLASGEVVPAPPVEIVPGGIEATQKVFDQLKAGVSGKKLVVEVK